MTSAAITIVGRMGKDPIVKVNDQGRAAARFTVATADRRKDEAGNWIDKPATWWNVVCYGKLAENAADILRKGTRVIITGRVETLEWDSQGKPESLTQIIADDLGESLMFPRTAGGTAQQPKQAAVQADPWAVDSAQF